VKNISAVAFDHASFRDAIAVLSQGEFSSSSCHFREQVVRLRNATLQRIHETQRGPYVTLMTDGGTIEKRKLWPIILYTSSRLYFCSLNRVQQDSTATTLAQVFGKEIDALWDRNISVVAATIDSASNLIKTFSGELLPGTFFPRQACSAHTAQLALFDNFGEGKRHADLTAMIRHVCETASADHKACPFLFLPRAPHWNHTRWNILYRMTGHLTTNESNIAVFFTQLQLQTEYEFVTIGPWRSPT
jgi:hypothetical protein